MHCSFQHYLEQWLTDFARGNIENVGVHGINLDNGFLQKRRRTRTLPHETLHSIK